MMRKLLLFFVMLSVSIGAWAYGGENGSNFTYDDGSTANFSTTTGTQTIAITAGGLANWASASNAAEQWEYFMETSKETPEYTKLVITGSLNADDLAVLQGDHFSKFTLVDMDGATLSGEVTANQVGVMDFNGAEYVSLPQALTKEQVKAFGETNAQNTAFKSAYSTSSDIKDFVAYIKVGGTLVACINNTVESSSLTDFKKSPTKLTVIGTPLPVDYACGYPYATNQIAADGHVSVSVDVSATNVTYNGTGTQTLNGLSWAFPYADVITLDLSEAIIEQAQDLTLPVLGYVKLKYLILPKNGYTEITRGSFAIASLQSVYFPPTLEVIRSGAFLGAACLYHIYTSGDEEYTKYDNGAVTAVASDGTETKYYGEDVIGQPLVYGTWTFPSSLNLIETYSFSAEHVKDLYVLSTTAPQCQVDAFGTRMYTGNNGYDPSYITSQGMITRDAYYNNTSSSGGGVYCWITMLHFPADVAAPDLQRYTDPTRSYSVASGLKDDRGNTVYLPTQDEWNRAYSQGTYGYVWNAWDPTRVGSLNAVTYLGLDGASGWTSSGQETANSGYGNWVEGTSNLSSFYDVTNNGNLTKPTGLEDYYKVYWNESTYSLNNEQSGVQLYPAAETSAEGYYKYVLATEDDLNNDIVLYSKSGDDYTTTSTYTAGSTYKRVQTQTTVNGVLQYGSCDNGLYVKDYTYEEDENGRYVQVATVSGYESTTTPVDGVSTYYSDQNGTEATPVVQDGYYVEDGEKNVYTAVDKNNDAIGAQSQYYTKNGDTYTPSNLMFYYWNDYRPLYYPDGKETVNTYEQFIAAYQNSSDFWNAVNDAGLTSDDIYVLRNGSYVKGLPNLNGTLYIKDGDVLTPVTTLQPEGTLYYDNNGSLNWGSGVAQISEAAYKSSGSVEKDKYTSSDYYIAGKTWYTRGDGDTYTAITLDWNNYLGGQDYYYVSGKVPNYISANGQDYNSSTTYYTNNTGTTVASPVYFNTTYYYPTYSYSYEEYTGQDGTRVKQVEYYRAATDGDTGQRYCPDMEDVVFYDVTNSNDYRGWHQFVLTGYSANTTVPTAYEKVYTSDTDWWTICMPYDLTRAEAMKLFSDGSNAPYVSKLRYVIRDVTAGTIKLCFTKNLMNYREGVNDGADSNVVPTTDVYHGGKDDNGILYVSSTSGTVADDDIVLHKGVPYLIKPTLPASASHRFQFTLTEVTEGATLTEEQELNNSLYSKIKGAAADEANWNNYIYNGIYTVPALVANNKATGGEATSGTVTINETEYGISTDFSYSFVGTFFKSLLPQYCYFLGWDSSKNKAAFWYNRVNDPVNWTWSNQTGIICPNYNANKTITAATGMNNPARWELAGGTDLENDDYAVSSSVGNAKITTMFFGAEDVSSSTTGISVIKPESKASETTTVYSIDGVRIGNTTESLPKGLYIVNGKKVVVK